MKIWLHKAKHKNSEWYRYFWPVWLNSVTWKEYEPKIYKWLWWGYTFEKHGGVVDVPHGVLETVIKLPPSPKCIDCVWAHEDMNGLSCKKRSPIVKPENDSKHPRLEGVWPTIYELDFCGDFLRKRNE